jgi:hypothetical protein
MGNKRKPSVNYKKAVIEAYRQIFSSGSYISDFEFSGSLVNEEISKRFKIGKEAIEKLLKKYMIAEENGDAVYINPSLLYIFSNLPFYINMGIRPPTSTYNDPSKQKQYGRTPDEISKLLEREQHRKIPSHIIDSWLGYHAGRILKGPEGYYFVNPFKSV